MEMIYIEETPGDDHGRLVVLNGFIRRHEERVKSHLFSFSAMHRRETVSIETVKYKSYEIKKCKKKRIIFRCLRQTKSQKAIFSHSMIDHCILKLVSVQHVLNENLHMKIQRFYCHTKRK